MNKYLNLNFYDTNLSIYIMIIKINIYKYNEYFFYIIIKNNVITLF